MKKLRQIIKSVLFYVGILKHQSLEYYQMRRLQFEIEQKHKIKKGNIYIVGCGAMGKQIIQSAIKSGINVNGICDLNIDRANAFKEKYAPAAVVFSSVEEMCLLIKKDEILVIATTADSHFIITSIAVSKGIKRIFLEKPISTSLADANNIIKMCADNNVKLIVDHLRRWVPGFDGFKRILNSGIIGKPVKAYYIYGEAGFAMIGTHLFDFMRMLFDSKIKMIRSVFDENQEVNKRGDKFYDPSGKCEFMLENGIDGVIDLSNKVRIRTDNLIVYCELGRFEVDIPNEKIRVFGQSGKIWEENFPWLKLKELAIAHALSELFSNATESCTASDGKMALEAAIACHISARNNNEWITLPINGESLDEKYLFA